MPKYYETPEFIALNEKWQKKLKRNGFDDIEQTDGNLKKWDSYRFRLYRRDQLDEAKETYYRYAGQFLYDYRFEDGVDKKIWKLHAEGVSIKNIRKRLLEKGTKVSMLKVFNTIKRLSTLMKIKYKLVVKDTSNG